MRSAARAALLDVPRAIRETLDQSGCTPEFTAFLIATLSQPGRALHPAGSAIWPRLVVEMAIALDGSARAAVTAAAAVELAVTAIDVADELIDGDWQGEPADRTRAQNASVAFGFLAQSCAARLTHELGPERAMLISRLLAEGSFACCDGQDLDILLERTTDVSEELAHDMTRRKSGSLIAMACRVGAAVATEAADVIAAAGEFGTHLGLVAQLRNDLADVGSDPSKRKGDLKQHKKTLPVAFALRFAREEGDAQILDWYSGDAPHDPDTEQELAVTFHRIGAHQYTWAVADIHRREARRALRALAATSGHDEVRILETIISIRKAA